MLSFGTDETLHSFQNFIQVISIQFIVYQKNCPLFSHSSVAGTLRHQSYFQDLVGTVGLGRTEAAVVVGPTDQAEDQADHRMDRENQRIDQEERQIVQGRRGKTVHLLGHHDVRDGVLLEADRTGRVADPKEIRNSGIVRQGILRLGARTLHQAYLSSDD